VEISWAAWLVSAAAVVVSGAVAWAEGNWMRRAGLAMGFGNHGGMWSDLVLLSLANAVIVPHLTAGWWLAPALALSSVASLWVHRHWYRPRPSGLEPAAEALTGLKPGPSTVSEGPSFSSGNTAIATGGDHMWPTHARGTWWRDLSWAGWAHVLYVVGELTLLAGFLSHPMPVDVVFLVTAIFTIHVPIGLLQPRWYRTGHIATVQEQPLLAPLLLALWAVTYVKLG
jgi:hypothetical protein